MSKLRVDQLSPTNDSVTLDVSDLLTKTEIGQQTGSEVVGFKSSLQNSSPRNVQSKIDEIPSVKDFGAKGDGVTDDSASFSLAAKSVKSSDISQADYVGMPHAEYCQIKVPAGKYLLSSLIDVGGKNITWLVDGGANFINPNNLNGRLERSGVKVNNFNMAGTLDGACGYSVANYRNAETPGGVLGVTAPNQLAVYTDRDTVGLYVDNLAPAIMASTTSASYTMSTVTPSTPLTADQVKKLRVGMIIDTKHTPNKYTGVITSWASDGTSITVEGWYLADGLSSTHAKVLPANGFGININPFTKAWALNANVFINSSSYASAVAGFELGVGNDKFDYDTATDSWHMWGYDVITLGSKLCETGYMQRGYFYKGYESRGAIGYNFLAANASGVWANQAVYASTANSDVQFLVKPDLYSNFTSFSIQKEGNIDMGRTDAAQTTFIDFHTSGSNIDYDARIEVSGGSTTTGQATMTLRASSVTFTSGFVADAGSFRPSTDTSRNLGSTAFRFNTVYASTGTINTSDVTKKTFFDISEAESKAAKEISKMIRKFKFNESIEEKGASSARYHFGVGAQQVRDVLIDNGLEPSEYAFLCHDVWEDIYDDDVLVKEAGELYGVRYDELLCFIISAI